MDAKLLFYLMLNILNFNSIPYPKHAGN